MSSPSIPTARPADASCATHGKRGPGMKRHRVGRSPCRRALLGAALLASVTVAAQASPIRADVSGSSFACAFLGGTGTTCGDEWFAPYGNSPSNPGSKVFSSDAVVSGNYPGSSFGSALSEAHTTLSMTASAGSISGSAAVSANYTGPRRPDPEMLAYHAWTSTVVNGRWFDTLTVHGGALGSSVLVRMTVSLQDTISGGSNDAGPSAWARTAQVDARLCAATGRDPESPSDLSYSCASLSDQEGGPTNPPRTGELEFWVEVGKSFEIYGVLGIVAATDIDSINESFSQWASVDAAHTMRGFFEIVTPLAGQTLDSDSGWDYRVSGGPTTPGNTVPEPLTSGLVAAALAGAATIRRRTARQSR